MASASVGFDWPNNISACKAQHSILCLVDVAAADAAEIHTNADANSPIANFTYAVAYFRLICREALSAGSQASPVSALNVFVAYQN